MLTRILADQSLSINNYARSLNSRMAPSVDFSMEGSRVDEPQANVEALNARSLGYCKSECYGLLKKSHLKYLTASLLTTFLCISSVCTHMFWGATRDKLESFWNRPGAIGPRFDEIDPQNIDSILLYWAVEVSRTRSEIYQQGVVRSLISKLCSLFQVGFIDPHCDFSRFQATCGTLPYVPRRGDSQAMGEAGFAGFSDVNIRDWAGNPTLICEQKYQKAPRRAGAFYHWFADDAAWSQIVNAAVSSPGTMCLLHRLDAFGLVWSEKDTSFVPLQGEPSERFKFYRFPAGNELLPLDFTENSGASATEIRANRILFLRVLFEAIRRSWTEANDDSTTFEKVPVSDTTIEGEGFQSKRARVEPVITMQRIVQKGVARTYLAQAAEDKEIELTAINYPDLTYAEREYLTELHKQEQYNEEAQSDESENSASDENCGVDEQFFGSEYDSSPCCHCH